MKRKSLLLITILGLTLISINLTNVKGQELTSYPVSYTSQDEKLPQFKAIGRIVQKLRIDKTYTETNFTEGYFDSSRNMFFYTKKTSDSWGSEGYVYAYSFTEKKVTHMIPFDNSGYYKYPISVSPNGKLIVMAESAQSVGQVNLMIIESSSGKTLKELKKSYSPVANWKDDDNFIFLEASVKCKLDICSQSGINLVGFNIKSNTKRTKHIADRDSSGRLPKFDILEISDGKIKLDSRQEIAKGNRNYNNLSIDLLF